MADGDLIFNTGIDNSGFNSGISNLQMIANTALGNIAADIASKAAAAAAQIPKNIYASGTGFESQLSTVQSISLASSEEMGMLKDKAAEMGAATSFSATESAQAFEYMAAAGWQTEDMLSGIDGIMALSAASGESLAGTSDIVTDSLTAFGMTAADSAGFADMLSMAASASNTNVAMLGESFKYVAPLFGAMSYSAEDASIALGLMANAGIKGSMAGTTLKTALANLVSPTDNMADVMDQYGISLKNADGTSKDFMGVMTTLRSQLGGLEDSEKAAAASVLFGKESMSGMLAVINASEEDFNNLTESIYDCEGAAKKMSDIRIDNLEGDITILESGIEGLYNSLYDSINAPLRDAAQQATEYINELSEAFTSGGFAGLAESAGGIISDAINYILGYIPQIVNTAVEVINALVSGLAENSDEIIGAAVQIVDLLVTGIFDMLPAIVDLALNIILSLAEGLSSSLPELIPAAVNICLQIAEMIIDNLDVFVEAALDICLALADGIIDALPVIIAKLPELIEGIVKGIVKSANKIVPAALELVTALTAALLSVDWGDVGADIIIAIGKGFLDGFDEALNPGKAAVKKQIEESNRELDSIRQKGQENIEQTNKEAAVLAQKADTYERLRNKVNLTAAEEELLKQTAEELQAVLPDNISLIDEQTGAYRELGTSIADVISKMRTQAILASKQDEFDELSVSIYESEQSLEELNKKFEEQKANFFDERIADPNTTYRELLIEYDPTLKGESDEVLKQSLEEAFFEAYSAGADLDSTVGEMANAVYEEQLAAIEDNLGINELEAQIEQYKNEYAELADEITNISESSKIKPDNNGKSNAELFVEDQRLKQEKANAYYEEAVARFKEKKGIADQSLAEETTDVSDAFKTAYEQLKTERLYSLISEDEYYTKLEQLLAEHNAYGVAAYNSYYKEIFDRQEDEQNKRINSTKEGMQKELSAVKASLNDVISTYKKQYNDLLNEQKNYKNGLKSQLDLFSKKEDDESITYTMESLDDYKAAVEKYTSSLKKLKDRGVSDDIISQIQSQGMRQLFVKNYQCLLMCHLGCIVMDKLIPSFYIRL